jgi:mediator of RNA polymerase II transcription subunit 6
MSTYIDIIWLTTQGLFKYNALEYFYCSQFYDSDCNNQLIRNQGVSVDHLVSMVGWEYSLDEKHIAEPHLYVIRKAYRKSVKEIEVSEVFYILNGVIYQSPNLYDLLRVKTSKISYNLLQSFTELSDKIGYSNDMGYNYNSSITKMKSQLANITPDEESGDRMEEEYITQVGGDAEEKDVPGRKKASASELPDFKQLLVDVSSDTF